jgi:nucleotide-binding universal stress UspA family protein
MKQIASLPKNQTETGPQCSAPALPLFSRILVPTDFSLRSEAALDYAVKLARRMHGQLTILHVLPKPSAFDYTMNGFALGEWEQVKEKAENNLADAVARAKRTFLEVDAKFRFGPDLHREILRTANEISADLLVLSTHGYTGWKHLLFGSDAEKILQQAPCPILVVR